MAARAIAVLCVALQAFAAAAAAQDEAGADVDTTRTEAAAGSAGAQFKLGTMYDLGIGGARDPARALRWYLSAAEAGLPEAQFNLAVMLDAGIDVAREPAAAALWYARAAASGHARAQYNLALLYAVGEGVPNNAALAGAWFDRAAETLPAARGQAPFSPAATAVVAVPERLSMHQTGRGITLVWTAPDSGDGTSFRVEILRAPQGGEGGEASVSDVEAYETNLSALQLPADATGAVRAWRVVQVDSASGEEAASGWARTGAFPEVARTLVKLKPRSGDDAAARTAAMLSATLQREGHLVMIAPGPVPEGASGIDLPDDADDGLARAVAAFLPGFGSVPIRRNREGDVAADMTVSIVGGGVEPPVSRDR